ncbi:MAG: SDR family NAD(P)-dependent oxidoreductase [Anaerolineae bacterium]|nr:SDR family NAD(P)-dependent oxidoreductase [Anaerolineae bacterium]
MSTIDRSTFGHDTTTDEVLEGIDLTGKLALITGGSSGLGAETARALASKGTGVVITARNIDKGEAVAQSIRSSTGNENVAVMVLELGSFASIRAFAEQFLAEHDALDILINNAGVMASPFAKTEDGFEMQFGTNHLGHFLLTGLLLPALVKAAPSRIVALSSAGHRMSPVVFEDINFEQRDYNKWAAYGQSKTANILHVVELDHRLAESGVRAYAVHPGVIQTELSRHMEQEDWDMMRGRFDEGAFKLKTTPAGAATSTYAATAPELDERGGVYLEDCHIAEINNDQTTSVGVQSYALDPESAKKLWSVSEEMVGQTFSV